MEQQIQNNQKNLGPKQYSEGHFINMWMGIGMAIGTPLGIGISFAIKNSGLMGAGLVLGMCIGLAIGSVIETKYKKQGLIRPLTEEERKKKQLAVTVGVVLLTLGAIAGLVVFLLNR